METVAALGSTLARVSRVDKLQRPEPVAVRRCRWLHRRIADTEKCGDILYRAFQTIADHHNFPRDCPSVEGGIGLISSLLSNRGFYGIVAERDGQIIGSSFVDQRSSIVGIGPVSVDPATQDQGVGRALTQAVVALCPSCKARRIMSSSSDTM